MTARLTAVLCNYNHGPTVGRAIEAMLTQSRPPDELIVVEDGSTDQSRDVIAEWAKRDRRIIFISNGTNLGLFASFEKALAAATGDYLYSGAADDYVLPGFFESVMDCCQRYPDASVASAKVVSALPDGTRTRVDGYDRFSHAVYLTPQRYLDECLRPEPPTHSLSSATIYRRAALQAIGGWQADLGSWADTFAIRTLGLTGGFCYVPQEAVVWVIQPAGLSQSTMRDPRRALQQVRLAAQRMRSERFRSVYPEDYVQDWESGMRESMVRQRLQSAMDAYQVVQAQCRQAAERGTWWEQIALGTGRRLMTACYLLVFHLQQRIIRRVLQQIDRELQS